MNLFGRAKAVKTTPKDAIVRLRESLDILEKREQFLEGRITKETQLARANATTNKRAALMALKRKKNYESQITKIAGSRMTLEQQVQAIENANISLETMNAMKAGADAMKQIHGHLDINKVDNTMDEIREQMELANEISEAISQPVNMGLEYDEDELNAELEQMEQEELDAKLMVAGPTAVERVSTLPDSIPAIAQPPRPERQKPVMTDEDAELEALQASMTM